MGCGCVNRRGLTHMGATLSFPSVGQIKGRLGVLLSCSHGRLRRGLLDSVLVWAVITRTAHFSADALCCCASCRAKGKMPAEQ